MKERIAKNIYVRGFNLMFSRYFEHCVGRDSAALTYYLLFSIFPLLIFFSNLVGFFAVDISDSLSELNAIIPDDALNILLQYLREISNDSSGVLLGFSLVFSIYFPFRAANCLMRSVRLAYGLAAPKNMLKYLGKTLLYTIFLVMLLPLSLVLVTLGERVLSFLSGLIYVSDSFIALWTSLRFVVLGLCVVFAIAVLYGLAQETHKVNRIWPGVLVSLLGWMIASLLFSLYVENASNYSVIYGSIGAVIVLLLWLYLSATMMIVGAEFNGVLRILREEQKK